MSTVAIIGAGDVGGAAAQALASRDRVQRVLIVDAAGALAAGKALDIQQSGALDRFHVRLSGAAAADAAAGAAACIVADRVGGGAGEWQGDDGLSMLSRLVPYLAAAPLVFAGARQSELMQRAARELGIPRERLVGSAPEAYASAVRAVVALEARCSPSEIALAVLGTPAAAAPGGGGSGLVVPWSEASIGGYALERVLSPVQVARIEARAARLWPPGPFTLGAAAARMAEAVAVSSRRTYSALTPLGGEFGVRNRIGALPVMLSSGGVAAVRVPVLNTRERVQVETSLFQGAP